MDICDYYFFNYNKLENRLQKLYKYNTRLKFRLIITKI